MPPISRRRMIAVSSLVVAGLFTHAGCSEAPTSTDGLLDDDLDFALRWVGVIHPRFDSLGLEVAATHPEAIGVARQRLGWVTSTGEMTAALRDGCTLDGDDGSLVFVQGWLMPATMAGLVAAVAVLRGASRG